MEDRLDRHRPARGGALLALAVIVLVTVAWWALALWPAGSAEPEWLARTRAACFGSARGGLPDAGGWVLLIGEPLGMTAFLVLLFGESLRRDMRLLLEHRALRVAGAAAALLTLAFSGALAARVLRPLAGGESTPAALAAPRAVGRTAPDITLQDQHGERVSLARIGTSVVTFAFGHCTTVCPASVAQLERARQAAGRTDLPIVVVTLDPWRDTPDRLPMLAQHFGLAKGDRVLSGSVDDVTRVLAELGVATRRNDTNGDVEHVAAAILIDSLGRMTWRIDGPPDRLASLLDRD